MNKELKILLNDNKNIYLYWDKVNGADSYSIVGLNKSFYKEKIKTTKNNFINLEAKDLKDYLKLGVLIQNIDEETGKEIIFGETNMVNIETVELNTIEINCIKSYKGITFSFKSDVLYDKYYLYEKKNNGLKLLIETEDWQFNSNKLKEGKEYYVEGYTVKDNCYQLAGTSEVYTCKVEKQPDQPKGDLTVVIPVYNAETLLYKSIDSILLSTLKGIEIILVNDGSNDKSPEIMKWYQEQYPNSITVINQVNKGVSFARNKGIEAVKTPYMAFVDSDDMVHPNMYQKLYDFAIENRLDTVIAKTIIKKDYGKYDFCLVPRKEKAFVYSFEKMTEELEKNTYENIFFHSACNKIMKTELIKEHPFPNYNEYEDIAFTMNVYSYIDYFGFVPDAYYAWDQRSRQIIPSLSTRYFEKGSRLNVQTGYRNSLFYCCHHGNPERINYLLYHSIKLACDYIKRAKFDLADNIYSREIVKLSQKYNLLLNSYLLKDREIYILVSEILKRSR